MSNSWVEVSVQVGDGLGYVKGDALSFRVGDPLLATLAYFKALPLSKKIRLTWQTLTEANNAGFIIWRGKPKGEKCTPHQEDYEEIMQLDFEPSQGGLSAGAHYTRIDDRIESGLMYCYLLSDIDLKDHPTFHWHSIVSAIAKD